MIVRPNRKISYRYYGSPKNKVLVDTTGWGPWRYDWYSICSAHQTIDQNCERCANGSWHNTWWSWIKSLFNR